MTFACLQNVSIFHKIIPKKELILCMIKRSSTLPIDCTVLLERNDDYNRTISFRTDMIGPPHPVSNLRPVLWFRTGNETQLQRLLRDIQVDTQKWNQRFWENHNARFIRERKQYIKHYLSKNDEQNRTLTADEMSGFYKEFLDKNWEQHTTYNFEWYRKNLTILFLSIAVHLEQLFSRS